MRSGDLGKVCASAALVAGIAGCTHGGGARPVSAKVSGKVEMVGGPYPGTPRPPEQAEVLVTDARRATVRRESVSVGVFAFALPRGEYQVSARTGNVDCGRPRTLSVRSSESVALSFLCEIK
jgi:hypothetical protein